MAESNRGFRMILEELATLNMKVTKKTDRTYNQSWSYQRYEYE